ncbi:MAG: hypothetical protein KDE00_13220 [Rhodobacteraceae bacterium]|nr:hypothetical protein [Paracoccaceae bacterium]
MSVLGRLWRDHRIALLAFLAAAAVTLFFAGRLAFFALYWSDPAHRDQHPAGWMTVGYVARSWHVPLDAMVDGLAIDHVPGKPRTLAELAADRGAPLPAFLDEVEALLVTLKAARPGP